MPETITSHNAEETRQWGELLAKSLKPGDIVALVGELGAGKTVLAQGILKGLGVEETVQSPSFIMAREYIGRLPTVHIDLYRLHGSDEFLALGFEEYLNGHYIAIIEWAEKALDVLPPHHHIQLEWVKDHPDQRRITHRTPDQLDYDQNR
jgi:tRNA threonylcarbamoyladenosine biosynthesis protein TsaE